VCADHRYRPERAPGLVLAGRHCRCEESDDVAISELTGRTSRVSQHDPCRRMLSLLCDHGRTDNAAPGRSGAGQLTKSSDVGQGCHVVGLLATTLQRGSGPSMLVGTRACVAGKRSGHGPSCSPARRCS
jgi:hypothetical protein